MTHRRDGARLLTSLVFLHCLGMPPLAADGWSPKTTVPVALTGYWSKLLNMECLRLAARWPKNVLAARQHLRSVTQDRFCNLRPNMQRTCNKPKKTLRTPTGSPRARDGGGIIEAARLQRFCRLK